MPPSYYYHLKLELYPSLSTYTQDLHQGKEKGREGDFFIPPPDSDIFETEYWPSHKVIEVPPKRGAVHEFGKLHSRQNSAAVIDCGPSRAITTTDEEGQNEPVPILPSKPLYLSSSKPTQESNITSASKDWRFSPVRIESLDMDSEVRPPTRMRGQSSAGNGINAGLVPTEIGGGGRVTKARFEPVEGKNTEVGWGIVHLYRDGEETVGLGNEVTEGVEGEEECTTLCIPAVPSYLTPSDFLGFVGEKTREEVSHFRMVMTGRMNRYLVLMKFRKAGDARKWRAQWDGKVFNSMEPETCHVLFVKSITFQTPSTSSHTSTSYPALSHDPFSSSSSSLKPFPPPTPSLVELPTCPVCLERMDDTTGLLTILCQHVFHCDCLQKWRGSGCPVCRHTNASPSPPSEFSSPFGSGAASLCSVCDCADDLWICLICGNVGCGRYKGGHAKEHWKESAHNFALEIETQHVWDYAGDLWVHRLIRGKGDGKVLEVGSQRQGVGGRGEDGVEMVPRAKLENIGLEYSHLLTSQLESQRVYFEELVSKAAAKASSASSSAAEASKKAEEALSKLKILELENKTLKEETVKSLEKDLDREKRKAEKSAEVARGFGKSLMEEKRVGEGLMKRIEFLNQGMVGITKEMEQLREENAELKESNRDLLFSISAQQKIQEMEEEGGLGKGELEEGTVSLPPEKKGRKGKGRGK